MVNLLIDAFLWCFWLLFVFDVGYTVLPRQNVADIMQRREEEYNNK